MRNYKNPRFIVCAAVALLWLMNSAHAQPIPDRTAATGGWFPGFERLRIQTSEATINTLSAGDGPAVLLLHGFPETHLAWRKVAPALAGSGFRVVVTDLRGYGDSSKPATDTEHRPYSKRAMARDQVEVMQALGVENFSVVGHDRGARVAWRMALDHPEAVDKIIIVDALPTYDLYTTTDMKFARTYFHWFFLIQDEPFPELMVTENPQLILAATFKGISDSQIEPDIRAEYARNLADRDTVHAMMEDYRAGATIDMQDDKANLGDRIAAPMLVINAESGAMVRLGYDAEAIWSGWADYVTVQSIPGIHYLAEENPAELVAAIQQFLGAP